MNDKTIIKIYWIDFVKKMMSLIAFTILAIVFEYWWIIFFVILFWGNSPEIEIIEKDSKEK